MQIGIPRESLAGETRVAATPNTVEQLKKLGFDVIVESGAGALASFDDAVYVAAGASVAKAADIWQSDIIYKVNAPSDAEIAQIKEGATLVSFLWPAQNPELVAKRMLQLVQQGTVQANDGSVVRVQADSICVHGDSPGAVAMARAVRERLEAAGVQIRSFMDKAAA